MVRHTTNRSGEKRGKLLSLPKKGSKKALDISCRSLHISVNTETSHIGIKDRKRLTVALAQSGRREEERTTDQIARVKAINRDFERQKGSLLRKGTRFHQAQSKRVPSMPANLICQTISPLSQGSSSKKRFP